MWRAKAPSRIRSGADVGMPRRTRGRAVTGPTHMACTFVRRALSTRSSMPITAARINTAATAGADVKLTASNFPSAMPDTSWSKSPLRGAGCQRYTRIGTTSAPAARKLVEKLGERIPLRRWRRGAGPRCAGRRCRPRRGSAEARGTTRTPATIPLASPAARSAPVAFGPRDTMRALPRAAISSLARPHPSAAAIQPRKPIPVVATTMSGGTAISASVCRAAHGRRAAGPSRWPPRLCTSAPRLRSSALSSSERRAEVTATRNPVSGAQSGSLMSVSVCSACFRVINRSIAPAYRCP